MPVVSEEGDAPALTAMLEPAVISVEAGAGASCVVRVHNGTNAAADVSLEVVGDAAAWAWPAPHQLALAPGAEGEARIVFRPPRTAQVRPGSSPFNLRLVAAGDATRTGQVDGVVEVTGFTAVVARLVPPLAEGRRQASLQLVLENEGTVGAQVRIDVRGDAGGVDVAVDPRSTDLAPRASQQATVTVRAHRPRLGWRSRDHRFRLSVTTVADGSPPAPVVVDGTLRQRPTRTLIGAVVMALLLGVGAGWATRAEPNGDPVTNPGGTTAVAVATAPPDLPVPRYAVGSLTETFVDPDRPTRAYASLAARPDRTLETLVFYPAAGAAGGEAIEGAPPARADGPFPLIVFAHGSGGLGDRYFGLLQTWAAAGYVVAAPVFPFASDPDQASPDDYPNQPADMTVVANELLTRNDDESHELAGLIDAERLGAAGHSLGGMTTLGLVANTCCYDERFDAGIVLAGRQVPFPAGDFWFRIRTPVLLIHGDADTSVVYADGRLAYLEAPPPKHLVTLEGADHSEPYQGAPDVPDVRVVRAATLAFFDYHLRGAEDGLDRMRSASNVRGTSRIDSET